jgi:hypothetical protein
VGQASKDFCKRRDNRVCQQSKERRRLLNAD